MKNTGCQFLPPLPRDRISEKRSKMNKKRYYQAFLAGSGLTIAAYGTALATGSQAAQLVAQGLLGTTLLIGGLALKKFVETEPINGVPACEKK